MKTLIKNTIQNCNKKYQGDPYVSHTIIIIIKYNRSTCHLAPLSTPSLLKASKDSGADIPAATSLEVGPIYWFYSILLPIVA